jgi:hypothetical protein
MREWGEMRESGEKNCFLIPLIPLISNKILPLPRIRSGLLFATY